MRNIQTYKTRRGAERYAAELKAKHPTSHFYPAVNSHATGFDWVVAVETGTSLSYAGKRPRNYGAK